MNAIQEADIKLLHKIMLSTNEDGMIYLLKELFCGVRYGKINDYYLNEFIQCFSQKDIIFIRNEIKKIMRDEDAIDEDWAFPKIVAEAKKSRKVSIQKIKKKIYDLVINNNEIYINFNADSFILFYLYEIDINKAIKERNEKIYKELIEKTWHPARVQNWCLSIDELKEL